MAKSINASGRVAGAKVVGSITHAAVWLGGAEAQDLNELLVLPSGVELTETAAINYAGAIAGMSSAGAFLLTPRD